MEIEVEKCNMVNQLSVLGCKVTKRPLFQQRSPRRAMRIFSYLTVFIAATFRTCASCWTAPCRSGWEREEPVSESDKLGMWTRLKHSDYFSWIVVVVAAEFTICQSWEVGCQLIVYCRASNVDTLEPLKISFMWRQRQIRRVENSQCYGTICCTCYFLSFPLGVHQQSQSWMVRWFQCVSGVVASLFKNPCAQLCALCNFFHVRFDLKSFIDLQEEVGLGSII